MSAGRRSSYARRVFINCPFDQAYKPLFDAVLFAVEQLGFEARHALWDDSEAIRLQRIGQEIEKSKFSIHDISRVALSGNLQLPRFNMPFEAGMAYERHRQTRAHQKHHVLLVDRKPYRYQASISDLAGLDFGIHHNKAEEIVACVRRFLRNKSGMDMMGETKVMRRFSIFQLQLLKAAHAKHLSVPEVRSWKYVNDLQRLMQAWIVDN